MASNPLKPSASVDIRFGKTDAVVLVLAPGEPTAMLDALKKRLAKASAIYQNEPVIVDLSAWADGNLTDFPLSLADLKKLTSNAGMNLIEVQSSVDEFEESCEQLGIRHSSPKAVSSDEASSEAQSESVEGIGSSPASLKQNDQVPVKPAAADSDSKPEAHTEATSQEQAENVNCPPQADTKTEPAAEPDAQAQKQVLVRARKSMVVNAPVRSGQRIYAQGSDLIVMGQVSAGAEVIADGNVHVYGVLRGRALAGAGGDTEAKILSTCFEAELVSIAGYYLTFEAGHPDDVRSQATLIQLANGESEKTVRLKPINIR